jgi:hypothetical protein
VSDTSGSACASFAVDGVLTSTDESAAFAIAFVSSVAFFAPGNEVPVPTVSVPVVASPRTGGAGVARTSGASFVTPFAVSDVLGSVVVSVAPARFIFAISPGAGWMAGGVSARTGRDARRYGGFVRIAEG